MNEATMSAKKQIVNLNEVLSKLTVVIVPVEVVVFGVVVGFCTCADAGLICARYVEWGATLVCFKPMGAEAFYSY